jgi:hypothetical protein
VDEPTRPPETLWFRRRDGGLGFAPTGWQGRAVVVLYVLLVALATATYSALALTAVVVLFYTGVFTGVLAVKSDLLEGRVPPRR